MGKKKNEANIWSVLSQIPKLIKTEFTTTTGKVNLACDLILAAVVAAIFAANTFERAVIAVVSIWNSGITEYLSSADTIVALLILVGFFMVCLVFVHIAEKLKTNNK